jgi:hypothetical protein
MHQGAAGFKEAQTAQMDGAGRAGASGENVGWTSGFGRQRLRAPVASGSVPSRPGGSPRRVDLDV